MVERLASAFGGGDSYIQVLFYLALPDEVIKTPWPQAGIKRRIFTISFTGDNTSYFNLTPLGFLPLCIKSHSEERRDEESRCGAGAVRIVPTTPRPFAEFTLSIANVLRVTWMGHF